MNTWWDDYYHGSSDYPLGGQDDAPDVYPDPWVAAEAELNGTVEAAA